MPRLNYVNVPESDLSLGIDSRSAENQLAPGFVRDLLNADIVEKRVRKRPGYQGYAGNLPFRITKLEYNNSNNEVCFTLDSAVDLQTSLSLETVRSSPIVVYGRSSEFTSGQGPFSDVDTVKYYSEFTVPIRKQFTAPSGTLNIPGTEHGLGTTNLFVDVVESTSITDRSYQTVYTDGVRINESSFDVDIDYSTYADRNVFVVFADKSTVTGDSYVASAPGVAPGTVTIPILAATHNLANFNILVQVQQDTGTERVRVQPDAVTIDSSGNVDVTITSVVGGDFYILLSATDPAAFVSGSIGATSTSTLTIPNVTSPWIFYSIYLEQTPGGTKEMVGADSIEYDDTTQDVTLTFTNNDSSAKNFYVFYEYGAIRSNQLCVTDASVTVTGTDTVPQLTLWGLEHTELYTSKSAREAWVSHIDSYRRSGEQRLISGLGGNLFSARTYSEAGSQYAYPLLYPNLLNRTSTSLVLAPLFWNTGETPGRSRGYITGDDTALHWARVTEVEYDSGTEYTKYTLSIPNKAILDSSGSPTTLGAVISTTTDLEDWVTIQGMSNSRHSGTFRIRQVTDGVNEIVLWVENDQLDNSDYDDAETGGEAAVLTDQLQFVANSTFIPQDILISDSFPNTLQISVLSSDGMITVVDGAADILQIGAGVLINGERTSSLVPLRSANPSSTASVLNLVRGDMLDYFNAEGDEWDGRLLRVLRINSDSDRTVSIAASSGTATVTMGSGDTDFFAVGGRILLLQAGVYTGVQVVTAIPSDTSIQFATTETVSVAGATLAGKTAEVDEELDWADSAGDVNGFLGSQRWIPVESPDDSFNLTPITHTRYLDSNPYANQPFLRSTMVQDNMYLSNYDDEVYKFDGTNMYRAGVLPWQPGAFLVQDTGATARIVADLVSVAYSAKPASPTNGVTIAAADANALSAGTPVRLSGSNETYTVTGYSDTGTTLFLDRALASGVSASGTIAEIGTFRYYYRLNAVDANSNIIASAVTGYQDHVVELTADAAVQHKLVGMPAWDVYDYDRLECEIYRTKKNQAAPFYKVTTQTLDFDNTQGYITYSDSFADEDLTDLDPVNTALKGSELGTGWSDPLRARYITSIGNRKVLGNVSDYPQLDFQIVAPASVANTDFAGDSILFRRSNTDTGTTTSMPDRVRYEWINGFTGTASGHAVGSGTLTFTTSAPHGCSIGDWVYLTYATVAASGRDLTYSGWWQIAAIPTGSSITVNIVGAAAVTNYPDRYVLATDPTDVPVLLGVDGNLGMVNGDSFDLFDTMRRLSIAINASMRQVDVTVTGMSTFTPWLISRGGNDVGRAGRLIVRQPRSDEDTFEAVPTFSGYALFVNSVVRSTGDQISASTRIYPSRILVSYENYPEIMDNPTSILDGDSDSAIDINSADGQEITGVIPFFGEAAFGAAQQSSILVVFKTNSIYLVDINQKLAGQNAVQRIETEGLGCTAPYSIAVTKGGITFANESGIYCLRRNQSIQYIGRFMERNWTERADLDFLSTVHGHHYGVGRSYKLSVPIIGTEASNGYIEPSEVFVYNHTGEEEGRMGAWGRYDNHPAIGWANLASDAYYASTNGRVFSIRRAGTETDFRDDNSPINMVLQTRPNDFGNAGIRKVTGSVTIHYRTGADSTGTTVGYALDLESEYSSSTAPRISQPTSSNGTSDIIPKDIASIQHTLSRRRGIYTSIEVANNALDESIEVAGMDFQVAGLQSKGIQQAEQSQSSR